MTDDDLTRRFAAALRRELGSGNDGAPVVNVLPAAVHISPEIRATMPALDGPLPVRDVSRQNGAYEWRLTNIVRDGEGRIVDAQMKPERFIPLEAFNAE